MARNKGQFKFAANFEVKSAELLDPRGEVSTKAELISKETFPYDGDTIYMKNGMTVNVTEEHAVYMLVDVKKILEKDYSGWVRVDVGDVKQDVSLLKERTPVKVVTAEEYEAIVNKQDNVLYVILEEE